ncbi:hypothetical protein DLEV_188 [Diachasmimorpha longicaudata entomopoxvirus]|uniref:Uncharacterized protein n=1 Tax=Diachasmimorpha longicaudata entomopoxvirus TaxID=109981 RepID=A0A7R5WMD1_9POXV|nr:hypothetical protein QKK69_gp188 [Diachasmimorpha longicaudata entomopoxvirus]AKS26479.1 hypothetical protein DLEV_188 [Diachasmimorpha longicaudata entomopoxvirus]
MTTLITLVSLNPLIPLPLIILATPQIPDMSSLSPKQETYYYLFEDIEDINTTRLYFIQTNDPIFQTTYTELIYLYKITVNTILPHANIMQLFEDKVQMLLRKYGTIYYDDGEIFLNTCPLSTILKILEGLNLIKYIP